jgi:hypothetical protein
MSAYAASLLSAETILAHATTVSKKYQINELFLADQLNAE